jgi:tetratricopeptide (TPR) repeat protein
MAARRAHLRCYPERDRIVKRRRTVKERAADFGAAAQRHAEEREAAAMAVDRLLRDTPKADWPGLAGRSDLSTWGALDRVGKIFNEALPRDPLHALAIAELAVSAAEGIGPHTYAPLVTAQLTAYAWKDLGKAYRALNRHQEAVDAFTHAESLVVDYGVLAHDRAIILFNLAVTLQEVDRHQESLTLLDECKDVFAIHNDSRLLVFCGIAEGVLLQRLRKYREAREAYLLILATAKPIEKESLAALHKAIGLCSIELKDFIEAESNLIQSIALYEDIRQPIEVLKAQTGLGRLYIRRGDVEEGIAHLRPIRRSFLQKAMPEEAGICALEVIEGLLHRGKASEAERLARLVIQEYTAARLSTRAMTALGYLTEAIATRNATVALVDKVREYILSLRTEPEREFRV